MARARRPAGGVGAATAAAAAAAVALVLAVLAPGAEAQVPENTTQVCVRPSAKSDAKDGDYYDACVQGAAFKGQDEAFNFNSAYVRNTTFTDVVFDGADFTYAFWEGVVFKDCVFKGGDAIWFDQALLAGVVFEDCKFEERAEFTQITFAGVEMRATTFEKGALFELANITNTLVAGSKFAGDETLFDRAGVTDLAVSDTEFAAVRFQLLASDGIAFADCNFEEFNCHEPLDDGEFASKRAEFDNLSFTNCKIESTMCDQSIFRGTVISGTEFGKGVHDFSSSDFTTLELDSLTEDGCAELDLADSTIEDGSLAADVDLCKINLGNTTLGDMDVSAVDILDDDVFEIEGTVLDGSKIDGECCVDVCEDKKCLCDIPGEAEDGCSRGNSRTNPNIDKSEDRMCFPADALVTLDSGASVRMDALAVGDKVAVGGGAFSPVYMFTHRDAAARAAFVALTTASGAVLRATPGHMVYANGALARAGDVRVGDALETTAGRAEPVVAVRAVSGAGLYNPQTLHGDVIVDGLRASSYTAALEPALAHAVSAPLRWAFGLLGLRTAALEDGAGALWSAVDMAGLTSSVAT